MDSVLPIVTSQSAVRCYQTCPRRRYWNYEAPNGTPTNGWERRKMAIPLVTGIYVHQGLEAALSGKTPMEAASIARTAYMTEVGSRGLSVEEGIDESQVMEEQAAHVEALVLAWCRVRLPRWRAEYEVVEVESEDRVPLSDDVTLAVRADMVVRRKADHRLFVVNFKTVGTADDRWLKGWEVDMQLMTELLAAERRHGQEFGGVIIEGLIKGRRTAEKDQDGKTIAYRDSSPLLYGYKCDANPPLTSAEYAWEYTRRKGWYRFPVWKEAFTINTVNVSHTWDSSLALQYWINWLPEEVVEAQFVTVPPIMRDEQRIASKVRQIGGIERKVRTAMNQLRQYPESAQSILDEEFPQHENECIFPSRCGFYDACFTSGVSDDMGGSGLYQARVDHHKPMEGSE